MSRGLWLGSIVCALACGTVTGQELGAPAAQVSPALRNQLIYTGQNLTQYPSPNQAFNPTQNAAPPAGSFDPAVKDLTPPGLTDLIPPPAPAQNGPLSELTGALRPFVSEKQGFYADAEFLLLRVRSENLDYVISNSTGGLATTGSIDSVEYKLTPALHAELGYRFFTNWDLTFGYTYVHSTGSDSIQAAPGDVLFPTLTRPGLTDTVLSASASAELNYNLYDAVLGRHFVLDEHSALRVYGGIRFADIGQNLIGQYNGGDAQQAAVMTTSHFEGVGPLVGGEFVFAGWRGLHLYARASGGLIGGLSANNVLETNNGGSTVYSNVNYNVQKVVPVASIGFGGGWEYRSVSIRFGYEMTQWYGLTERVRFTDDVAQGPFTSQAGSLSLEGLFVQFVLKF